MGNDMAKRYDQTSGHYDKRYREIQFDKYRMALSFLDGIYGEVLDVGCGTGLLGEFLDMQIWGIDISKGMLDNSKGRVRYVLGDARKLPFEDSHFDFVFSFTVLQNIPDYEIALKEIGRVLKDDGRCVLSYLNKQDYSEIGKCIGRLFNVIRSFRYSEDSFYICTPRADGK